MKKILFIGHDANRAGAQFLLLHLLTYLRDQGVPTALLLQNGGPLLADYEAVTDVVKGYIQTRKRTWPERFRHKLGYEQPTGFPFGVLEAVQQVGATLIFSNTIANGGALWALRSLGLPFMCYVHELETSIGIYTRPDDVRYQMDYAQLVLCGSSAVQRNLVESHGLNPERTAVLNSLIRTEPLRAALAATDRAAVRRELGIPAGAPVLGGCGHAEWRKGVDLFLSMAQQVAKARPDAHFVWFGVKPGSVDDVQLRHDAERMGLTGRVHLLPPGPDYLRYVATFDVFTLTSREDPYPLVMLEAGLNRTPVLAFTHTGGAADYVDAPGLVPYADVTVLAERAVELLQDPTLRQQRGATLYERALAHDVAVLGPQLLALLAERTPKTPVAA